MVGFDEVSVVMTERKGECDGGGQYGRASASGRRMRMSMVKLP